MDFTLFKYRQLLQTLQSNGFIFKRYDEFCSKSQVKFIILRHDVDKLPQNSLITARIEHELGIKGTYYFRIVPESYNKEIIKCISDLGHEIGYHYEDMSFACKQVDANGAELEKKIVDLAIGNFAKNLRKLLEIVPIKTICMHGSPLSSWDSRLIWKYYSYKDFGIIGEPYFDINFENMLYLTDTGRKWNGQTVSIRDKANSMNLRAKGNLFKNYFEDWTVKPVEGSLMNMTIKAVNFQNRYNFHSTNDIIRAITDYQFSEKVLMTFHPQRWTSKNLPWINELLLQNIKNSVKFYLVTKSSYR